MENIKFDGKYCGDCVHLNKDEGYCSIDKDYKMFLALENVDGVPKYRRECIKRFGLNGKNLKNDD